MASHHETPYRLDELGWLQFERLATLVLEAELGVSGLSWQGAADTGRRAVLETGVVVPGSSDPWPPPVTLALIWIPAGLDDHAVLVRLNQALALDSGDADGSVLTLTNLAAERARAALPGITVWGASEIAASLDRHASIRAAMPSVLGLVDLGDITAHLIDADVAAHASLDVPAAHELARVFWPTRAYDRAREVLTRHRFVVLTGPPEMGKTAIAQLLALALMTDGWDAHECNDPERVLSGFDPERRQVFVADDAFGSTEYRPDAGERWATALERLLGMLDDRHRLIWTSRPAPLKAGLGRIQRERGAERFPAPSEVLVDASDLDLAEKTLILFRHVKAHGVSGRARGLVRSAGLAIVEHPHFTPERIRRFVTGRLDGVLDAALQERAWAGPDATGRDPRWIIQHAVEEELAQPTEAMRTSFAALEPEHRDLLIALLDAPAGLIDERALTETVRRHHSGGLNRRRES